MKVEKIITVVPVVPKTGTNAGVQMYVINNKYWSRHEPTPDDTHVVLEDVVKEGKTYTNVTGFSKDTRMDIQSKIKLIVEHDAGYSVAIATLLK
jgi:hypothetical protein